MNECDAALRGALTLVDFRRYMAEGKLPKPVMVDGRKHWNANELDAAYAVLHAPKAEEKAARPRTPRKRTVAPARRR